MRQNNILTILVILVICSANIIALKQIRPHEAINLNWAYNQTVDKYQRRILFKQYFKSYGPKTAHKLIQRPFNKKRILWGLGSFVSGIKNVAHNVSAKVSNTVSAAKNSVTNAVKKAGQSIKSTAARAAAGVKNAAANVATKIKVSAHNLKSAVANVAGKVVKLAAHQLAEVKKFTAKVAAGVNDAKNLVKNAALKIKAVAGHVMSAAADGLKKAGKAIANKVKNAVKNVGAALNKAKQAVAKAGTDFINKAKAAAKKAGQAIVKVGKAAIAVASKFLKAALEFVKKNLLPKLKKLVQPIWEKAKSMATKFIKDHVGVDISAGFKLKFNKAKFSKQHIQEGMKKVAKDTLSDSIQVFIAKLKAKVAWLGKTLAMAALKNAPFCMSAVAVALGTAGAGAPSIGACAMGIMRVVAPQVTNELITMGKGVAAEEKPKVVQRMIVVFCPIEGANAAEICAKGAAKGIALGKAAMSKGKKIAVKVTHTIKKKMKKRS